MKERKGHRSGELERVRSELRRWRARKRGVGRIPATQYTIAFSPKSVAGA